MPDTTRQETYSAYTTILTTVTENLATSNPEVHQTGVRLTARLSVPGSSSPVGQIHSATGEPACSDELLGSFLQ